MKRRKTGTSERSLRKNSAEVAPVSPLPLVHVTAVGNGREIIKQGKIQPVNCKVFGKELVYLFVARPDYKIKGGDQKREYISYFPMAFIFDCAAADRPFHIFPFDTGGAADGVFSELADEFVYLEDYELDSELNGAFRHIAWVFGSSANYFDGHIKPELISETPAFDSTTISYLRIAGLASEGSNRPDRRASAVEVAIRTSIVLADHLKHIIAPAQMIEDIGKFDEPLREQLRTLSAEIAVYDWKPNETPDFYMTLVRKMVRDRIIS